MVIGALPAAMAPEPENLDLEPQFLKRKKKKP
jgi:hypothetical protein